MYLIKTDSNGNFVWSKTFEGTGDDFGYSIENTTDGGYIISGSTNSFGLNGVYLVKTDNVGNMQWSKAITGTNAKSVKQKTDGGYILGAKLPNKSGGSSVLLIKTDSLGNAGTNGINPTTINTSPNSLLITMPITVDTVPFILSSRWQITISSGSTDSTLCTPVGIDRIKTSPSFYVSPNPSSGNFVITLPSVIKNGTVEIYNAYGE